MTEPIVPPLGAGALTRRIFAFAGVPFISVLAPFLFLPVLARLAGAEAWVAIALGQSIGGFAALVVGLGYSTFAPPDVAVASPERRRRILATSIHARLPVWLVVGTIAVVIAALLAPASHRLEAALMAGVMSLAGLAPTWFWIGVGRAAPILWTEVIPRIVATLAAAVILILGGAVAWYPVLLGIAMLVGPVGVGLRVSGSELARVDRADLIQVLRRHPPAVIAESAAGAYNALAVTLVTAVAPIAEVARYVSGDKVYRIGQYSVSAVGNALQGWVAEARADDRALAHRLRVTALIHGGLGVVGLVAFGLLGPWVTALLFGEAVAIDGVTAWGFSIAILGIALGTAFGRIGLVTLGARKSFMTCVLVASGVGVAALLVAGGLWGAAGAAWALGLTELFSGTVQGIVLASRWRARARARGSRRYP